MNVFKSMGLAAMLSAALLICVVVMIPFTGTPYMGLVERVMVSGYQIFYFVSGLVVFVRN